MFKFKSKLIIVFISHINFCNFVFGYSNPSLPCTPIANETYVIENRISNNLKNVTKSTLPTKKLGYAEECLKNMDTDFPSIKCSQFNRVNSDSSIAHCSAFDLYKEIDVGASNINKSDCKYTTIGYIKTKNGVDWMVLCRSKDSQSDSNKPLYEAIGVIASKASTNQVCFFDGRIDKNGSNGDYSNPSRQPQGELGIDNWIDLSKSNEVEKNGPQNCMECHRRGRGVWLYSDWFNNLSTDSKNNDLLKLLKSTAYGGKAPIKPFILASKQLGNNSNLTNCSDRVDTLLCFTCHAQTITNNLIGFLPTDSRHEGKTNLNQCTRCHGYSAPILENSLMKINPHKPGGYKGKEMSTYCN